MRARWTMERKLPTCSATRTGRHNPQQGGAAASEYIGIDLHKAKSFVTWLTLRDRVLEELELVHTSGELQQYRARQCSDLNLNPQSTSECVRPKQGVTTWLEM
jgi:hypothetical protein